MAKNKVDDYSLVPVPREARQGLYSMMTTYAGYGMSCFNLILGGTLGVALDFKTAIIAILIGNAIITLIGICCSFIGERFGLSTTILTRGVFGKKGQVVTTFMLALLPPGFVGMYVSQVGGTLTSILPMLPWFAGSIFFLVCISLTSIYGFKGLAKLSWIAVPLIIVLSFYGINKVGGFEAVMAFQPEKPMTLFAGISAVIAGWVTGGVLAGGDVGRYAKNRKEVAAGNIFGWFICSSIVEIVGCASAAATGNGNVAMVLIAAGVIIPGFILYFLLMWTTADNNLYAFSLSLINIDQTFAPNTKRTKKFWLIVGAVCVFVVSILVTKLGISAWLNLVLGYVGRIVPAIGAIITVEFFINGRIKQSHEEFVATQANVNWRAFAALAIGFIFSCFGPIPSVQNYVAAFIAYIIICKATKYDPCAKK